MFVSLQIVANVLLTLFQQGWEPMTPLDMGLQMKESSKSGPQVRKAGQNHGVSNAGFVKLSLFETRDSCNFLIVSE